MKNRKGFTITELVIVIAVIAILAAVLIPTFTGVINKANESAALQKAKNAYTAYVGSLDFAAGATPGTVYVEIEDGQYFAVTDGEVNTTKVPEANLTDDDVVIDSNGAVVDDDASTSTTGNQN